MKSVIYEFEDYRKVLEGAGPKLKELVLDRMYEALKTKISREQVNLDVKLATLNEYIEFVEAEEDEDGWYLEHAQALAEELLNL